MSTLSRVPTQDETEIDNEVFVLIDGRVLRLANAVAATWRLLAEPTDRRALRRAVRRQLGLSRRLAGPVTDEALRHLGNEGLLAR